MQTYLVGGAVRDALMGLPVQDRDWIVVGSSPQAMLDAGYKPVGRDFPVFLHPHTREEYALARAERKTGPGYRGFMVQADASVTLEQDLGRRDLTINAMAVAATDVGPDGSFDPASVVDPFAVWLTCVPAPCATAPMPFAKTRFASCAWHALLPGSLTFRQPQIPPC